MTLSRYLFKLIALHFKKEEKDEHWRNGMSWAYTR